MEVSSLPCFHSLARAAHSASALTWCPRRLSLPVSITVVNIPGTADIKPGQYLVEPAILRSCDKRLAGHSLPGSQLSQALVAEDKTHLVAEAAPLAPGADATGWLLLQRLCATSPGSALDSGTAAELRAAQKKVGPTGWRYRLPQPLAGLRRLPWAASGYCAVCPTCKPAEWLAQSSRAVSFGGSSALDLQVHCCGQSRSSSALDGAQSQIDGSCL